MPVLAVKYLKEKKKVLLITLQLVTYSFFLMQQSHS